MKTLLAPIRATAKCWSASMPPGLIPVDWKIREGQLKGMLHHTFPLVLGWDVSGVVEGLGSGLTRLKIGDEVFSRPDISRDGAYAEFIVIKESEVALKPKSIDHSMRPSCR